MKLRKRKKRVVIQRQSGTQCDCGMDACAFNDDRYLVEGDGMVQNFCVQQFEAITGLILEPGESVEAYIDVRLVEQKGKVRA